MNWRTGLLRLWMVASVCWGCVVVWLAYVEAWKPRHSALDQLACMRARNNHLVFNQFDCPNILRFDDLVPIGPAVAKYTAIAVGPIIGVLIIGIGIAWAASGFRRERRRAEDRQG